MTFLLRYMTNKGILRRNVEEYGLDVILALLRNN